MADSIKLDPESLSHLVQKAVLDSITPEARDQLVTDAIKSLLTMPAPGSPGHYAHPKQTPLQAAFDSAIMAATHQVVTEAIQDSPEVQQAIRDVVHPVVADLAAGNYDGLPEKIGEAFAEWLRGRR